MHKTCKCGAEKPAQQGAERSSRHDSAHFMNIHEHRAPACPCVMTHHDNCGSRLLQPLVSVTKIGTQVSCHSKSLFFRSLSIKRSGPHAKMPQGEERRPSRGCGECFRKGSRSGRSPGRIKNKCVYRGGGGKNMSAFWGQRRIVEKRRASFGNEARQSLQRGGREGRERAAVPR